MNVKMSEAEDCQFYATEQCTSFKTSQAVRVLRVSTERRMAIIIQGSGTYERSCLACLQVTALPTKLLVDYGMGTTAQLTLDYLAVAPIESLPSLSIVHDK